MKKIFIASDHAGFNLKKSIITRFSKKLKFEDLGPLNQNKPVNYPDYAHRLCRKISKKSNNIRGVFWTRPDSTGKEVIRDSQIDESKYTEFVEDYKNTYFKEVYEELSKRYKLGRVRLLLKEPRSTLSWHRDPEPRLHIPIYTNPGAIMVIDQAAQHMPADGSVWITNNLKYHNAFNGGEENRVHLVACVLDHNFN